MANGFIILDIVVQQWCHVWHWIPEKSATKSAVNAREEPIKKRLGIRIIRIGSNAVIHWDISDETIRCFKHCQHCQRYLSEESGEPSGFGLNSQMQSFAKKYFTSGSDIEITEVLLNASDIWFANNGESVSQT